MNTPFRFWIIFIMLISGISCSSRFFPKSEPDGGPCEYEILDFTARLDAFTESIAVFDGGKYSIEYIELPLADRDSLELTALYKVYVQRITLGSCNPLMGSIRKVGPALE